MATISNPHLSRPAFAARSSIQKVCIVMGAGFVLIGLAGLVMPGLMGMHLSMSHNLIHLISGALALSMGYSDHSKKAYNFAVTFGVVYGLLGLVGFIVGQPGYPGVGNMEADQNLLRVIPNVLEFGTMDHSIHLIISSAFLLSAFAWKRTHLEANKSTADAQRRSVKEGSVGTGTVQSFDTFDSSNGTSDLSKSELGKSDISSAIDQDRRKTNYENRI